jgi:hypothetical protein
VDVLLDELLDVPVDVEPDVTALIPPATIVTPIAAASTFPTVFAATARGPLSVAFMCSSSTR